MQTFAKEKQQNFNFQSKFSLTSELAENRAWVNLPLHDWNELQDILYLYKTFIFKSFTVFSYNNITTF